MNSLPPSYFFASYRSVDLNPALRPNLTEQLNIAATIPQKNSHTCSTCISIASLCERVSSLGQCLLAYFCAKSAYNSKSSIEKYQATHPLQTNEMLEDESFVDEELGADADFKYLRPCPSSSLLFESDNIESEQYRYMNDSACDYWNIGQRDFQNSSATGKTNLSFAVEIPESERIPLPSANKP